MSNIIPGWPHAISSSSSSSSSLWPGILTAGVNPGGDIGFEIGGVGSLEGTVLEGAFVTALLSATIAPGTSIFILGLQGDWADALNTGAYRDHKLYVDNVEVGRVPEDRGFLFTDAEYDPELNWTTVGFLSQDGVAFVEDQTYEVKLDYLPPIVSITAGEVSGGGFGYRGASALYNPVVNAVIGTISGTFGDATLTACISKFSSFGAPPIEFVIGLQGDMSFVQGRSLHIAGVELPVSTATATVEEPISGTTYVYTWEAPVPSLEVGNTYEVYFK